MENGFIVLEKSSRPTPLLATHLNTKSNSPLHTLATSLNGLGAGVFTLPILYSGAVLITLLPLFIGAWLSSQSITTRSTTLPLPLLYDASTILMYSVSLPCLLLLTVTDDQLLRRALGNVQTDGILIISQADQQALATSWRRRFRSINAAGLLLGILSGAITAYYDYQLRTSGNYVGWDTGNPLPATGYILMYCDFLFSVVAAIFLIRSLAIIALLRDVVSHAEIHMLPLHPDNAGGLRPIGRLGLRNQYAITILGINIGVGWLVSHFLTPDDAWAGFITIAAIAYFTFSPLVFIGPLLPFRDAMLKSKAELMSGIASRLRTQLTDLRLRFESGAITSDDEQIIERLRKIGAVINDLPVWPFDALTLRKFVAAYIAPIGSIAVPFIGKTILRYFDINFSPP